jgi:hypothetical protein
MNTVKLHSAEQTINADPPVHATLRRMYDLLYEDFGLQGPANLGRKLGETTQAVNNWSKSPGVSSKGAVKAQHALQWNAQYILYGEGPKRLKPTLQEIIHAPLDVAPDNLTYAPVKGRLFVSYAANGTETMVKLDTERKTSQYVLVLWEQHEQSCLEAYHVDTGVFSHTGRVREGEYLVCHNKALPSTGDDVLVKHKQGMWSLERFIATFDGLHLFQDASRKGGSKNIEDFDEWRVVVGLNSPRSVVRVNAKPVNGHNPGEVMA